MKEGAAASQVSPPLLDGLALPRADFGWVRASLEFPIFWPSVRVRGGLSALPDDSVVSRAISIARRADARITKDDKDGQK